MTTHRNRLRRPISATSTKPSLAQAVAVHRETLLWSGRAESWETEGSVGLTKVVDEIVSICRQRHADTAIDLGCGSGQVTIPLADSCSRILAVDVSAPAIEILEAKAREAGVRNIQVLTHPIETLELDPGSVDLVVSNYALHHLRDADKAQLLCRAMRWLAPGGRLVIGDMMFGRGAASADRAIIRAKVGGLAKRGPGGWWRILKNAWRFALRIGERPLPASSWEAMVRDAGFEHVHCRRVVAEACVLSAVKPAARQAASVAETVSAGA